MYKKSGIETVIDELWSLIKRDKMLEKARKTNRASDRSGIMKRMFYDAIMESSLGMLNGRIYYFDGDIYSPLDEYDFYIVVYRIRAFNISDRGKDALYDEGLKKHCERAVMSKKLVLDNSVIVFRNCVLDVKDRKTYKFDKKFVQISRVDYDYTPGMKTFKWWGFLASVLPEIEKRELLQMFLGACFVNRWEVKLETMLILLGKGANGKSVIQETVRGVLGEDNVSKSGLKELCHGGSVGDQTIMIINGKRLNYCSEIQGGEFDSNVDRLKAIISGEPVYGRSLYHNRSEARNIPLIMANANTMPSIKDNSYGMQRRISVIKFDITVPVERRNPHLADELREEYPGIMNWILDGRDMLAERGYRLPCLIDGGTAISEQQTSLSTPIIYMRSKGWLPKFENVNMEAMMRKTLDELYSGYSRWCEINVKEATTKIMFSKELVACGYEKDTRGNKVTFSIYSKDYVRKLKESRFDDNDKLVKKAKESNPKGDVMTVDGEVWATSMKALADCVGVSLGVVRGLNLRGKFKEDGCIMAYREKRVYNIRKCVEVMKREKVAIDDEEKLKIKYQQRVLKYERYIFNQAMKYNGLPYRKYSLSEPQITGYKVVDDTMTEYEAFELAHKELGFDISKVRKSKGSGSRGGIGFTKDLLEENQN